MTASIRTTNLDIKAAKEAKKFALLMTPLCLGLIFLATHYSFSFMNSDAPALAGVFGAGAIVTAVALAYVFELARKKPVPVTV